MSVLVQTVKMLYRSVLLLSRMRVLLLLTSDLVGAVIMMVLIFGLTIAQASRHTPLLMALWYAPMFMVVTAIASL